MAEEGGTGKHSHWLRKRLLFIVTTRATSPSPAHIPLQKPFFSHYDDGNYVEIASQISREGKCSRFLEVNSAPRKKLAPSNQNLVLITWLQPDGPSILQDIFKVWKENKEIVEKISRVNFFNKLKKNS